MMCSENYSHRFFSCELETLFRNSRKISWTMMQTPILRVIFKCKPPFTAPSGLDQFLHSCERKTYQKWRNLRHMSISVAFSLTYRWGEYPIFRAGIMQESLFLTFFRLHTGAGDSGLETGTLFQTGIPSTGIETFNSWSV